VPSEFDPGEEDREEAADLDDRARTAFGEDRAEAALLLIERSLDLDPSSFDAWSFKAKILVGMDRGPEAFDAVEKALTIEPNDYDALAEKSGILSMLLGDLESGLRYALLAYAAMTAAVTPERRAERDGDDFWAVENVYDNLYYALYRLERFEEAAKIRAEAASFGHEFAEGIDDAPATPESA